MGQGKYENPCAEASAASLKCQTENPGNKDACREYIEIYKECKRQWVRCILKFIHVLVGVNCQRAGHKFDFICI